MTDEFDEKLRAALRPVEPAEGFAARVMERVAKDEAPVVVPIRKRAPVRWFAGVGLAASVVLAVFVNHSISVQRDREGFEARRQLMEALRVTSQKLDVAYQAVNKDGADAGV
jgi:hypothetical protein